MAQISEKGPNMTLEEINNQYAKLCSELGDHIYRIKQHESEVQKLYKKIDKLNEIAHMLNNSDNNNNHKSTKQAKQGLNNE